MQMRAEGLRYYSPWSKASCCSRNMRKTAPGRVALTKSFLLIRSYLLLLPVRAGTLELIGNRAHERVPNLRASACHSSVEKPTVSSASGAPAMRRIGLVRVGE